MPSRPMRRLSGQPAHFNLELETKIPWSGIRMMMKIRMTFTYFILMTQTSDNRELVIIIAYQYIHILWRHARLPWLEGEGANTPLTKEADKLDELELYDSFRFPVWYILNHVKNNIPPSLLNFGLVFQPHAYSSSSWRVILGPYGSSFMKFPGSTHFEGNKNLSIMKRRESVLGIGDSRWFNTIIIKLTFVNTWKNRLTFLLTLHWTVWKPVEWVTQQ